MNNKRFPSQPPKVSVVLPTYNQANYLPLALDSIFNQTWQDIELIVVNDGSTDNTAQVLQEYQQRFPFHVINQPNQKLPCALNNGFRQASGDYLTWTSSDNILLPNMLEELVKALELHPEVGMVYADWQVIDEQGNILRVDKSYDFDRYVLMRVNYINACFLYRRACQEKVGLYDPDYIHAEDWEYWLRISHCFRMLHVPQTLYQFRVHGSSLTQTSVHTEAKGESVGYRKMREKMRANRWVWYFSRFRLEWTRFRVDGEIPFFELRGGKG